MEKRIIKVNPYQVLFWAISANKLILTEIYCSDKSVTVWKFNYNEETFSQIGNWDEMPIIPNREWILRNIFDDFKKNHPLPFGEYELLVYFEED